MSVVKLYQICLSKISCFHANQFLDLPLSCLYDILPYLSPFELERLDQRCLTINHLWRYHFELIWSLSRDDRDAYESISEIPYRRLYFEYLFHDTQILQLGIYTHIAAINQSKSIVNLTFVEHMKYNLTRDSIIYCSKRRLADENADLVIHWNQQWNKYIKRFILVPHVWNLAKLDPSLIECFTENVTEIILSGYPTENDNHGMKFILDILMRGNITNMILKFPSYCLMNILLPLLIYPRGYSLSYFSSPSENQSNLFLPIRKRKLCLQVQIHSNEEMKNIKRVLSTNQPINEEEEEEDDASSTDTTRAIVSDSNHSLDHLQNLPMHSSTIEMRTHTSERDLSAIQSSHLITSSDNHRSTVAPYQRLLPYLNRSRPIQQYSTLVSVLTPARHLSTSEQSVSRPNLITEPISSSDNNLFRRYTTATPILSAPTNQFSLKQIDEDFPEEKSLLLHLTPQNQTNSLTHLSICYVSSFETIEMIAIALLGTNQIQHLTLVNFAIYSSQLETSLITLCTRAQLRSLHLTSISFVHGAIGFLLQLFRNEINLKQLRLDAIKIYALFNENIHLSDIEQTEFLPNTSLEQFVWRERHMQSIHMRLLYKFIPNIMSRLHRLELSSILECIVFDQFGWCQTLVHGIRDVRLRNFRIRSINLRRFFSALNAGGLLTVFHFERVGMTWTNDPTSNMIHEAFTYLILHARHLVELSLAYNNLNNHFIQWLCQMLLWQDGTIESNERSWWSIVVLNLTFNLISSEAIRTLMDTLKEYRDRWRIRHSPIRRIDILGNALEMREIPSLKKQFNALGCELISYILP